MTAVLSVPVGAVRSPHGAATTVLLHLAPGAVGLLAFVGLLPLAGALGLPSVAALAGVGLFVVPAVQLGILQVHRRRRPFDPAVALGVRLPLPRVLGWAVLGRRSWGVFPHKATETFGIGQKWPHLWPCAERRAACPVLVDAPYL